MDVEEHFEYDRKNYVEEDAHIAQTIIHGVQEYTEFKVSLTKKQNLKLKQT